MAKRFHGDALFGSRRRRSMAPVFLLLLLIILFGLLFIYNLFYNTRPTLIKQSVTISGLPSGLENFKILHISDLDGNLFGAGQENLVSLIDHETYHAVCVTGDITDEQGSPRALIRLLDQLPDDIPVYFIAGDEDPQPITPSEDGTTFVYASYVQALQNAGAVYLDAPQLITRNNCNIWFSPEMLYTVDVSASKIAAQQRVEELQQNPLDATASAQLASALYMLDRFARLEEAQKLMTPNDTHIALTHVPLSSSAMRDLHDSYANGQSIYMDGVSLVLAGHYNAGQWRIPGLGPVYVPDSLSLMHTGFFPDDSGLVGLQSMMSVTQYISPGLGASDFYPFPISTGRFLTRPSVTLLSLTSKLTAN